MDLGQRNEFPPAPRSPLSSHSINGASTFDKRSELMMTTTEPALAKSHLDSIDGSGVHLVTPRRSARRAAKLANERMTNCTKNRRRRTKVHPHCRRKLKFGSDPPKVVEKTAGVPSTVSSPTPEYLELRYKPRDQVDRSKSEGAPTSDSSPKLNGVPPIVLVEAESQNPHSKDDSGPFAIGPNQRQRCVLFLLTAIAKISGGIFSIFFAAINFGVPLLTEIATRCAAKVIIPKNNAERVEARIGLSLNVVPPFVLVEAKSRDPPPESNSGPVETESNQRQRCTLFLSTAIAKISGGMFFLFFATINFGVRLLAKIATHGAAKVIVAKSNAEGAGDRIGLSVLFSFELLRRGLKLVPIIHGKYARFGLALAGWVFTVYLLLPACALLCWHIFWKCHVAFTCIALLAVFW